MKYLSVLAGLCLTLYAYGQTPPEPAPATPEGVEDSSSKENVLDPGSGMMETVQEIQGYLEEHPEAMGSDASAANGMMLDIHQAVRMALQQNAQATAAQKEAEAAEARIGQARSQGLPQIEGRYGITHTEYNTAESGGLASLLTPSGLQPDDTLETTEVGISQALYTGGQIGAAIKASRYLADSQAWRRDATLAEIEFQTKEAFYNAILASALVQVAEDSVKTFERNLSDAQEMFDVGMISNFEVLRAKTEVGARKADLVAARNQHRLALTNLRRILYIPEEAALSLVPKITWTPPTGTVDEYVDNSYENRPELKALESGILAAGQDLRRVKGQYLPSVGANADYRNTDGGGASIPDGWTFTVGAEWEIFGGGRRKYERLEARARVEQLEYELLDVKQLVKLDVTQAHIQLQDAMAQAQSERGNVDLAEEGLRLAELRFQEGVGTQSEVLDAELALTAAKTNLLQALRNYAVAHAALERATGTSWYRSDGVEEPGLENPEDDGVE